MNKINILVDLYLQNKLSEANELFAEILTDKIILALQEKREEILEGGNPENKKKKNRVEFRVGKNIGAGSGKKHIGREIMRSADPERLKAILTTEGTIKDENKQHKREVERRVQRNLEKNHGGGGGLTGRLVMKLLPSETIKALSKKQKAQHWSSTIGLYGEPVAEETILEAKPMPYKDVHKLLTNAGFLKVGQNGSSHIIYKHPKTGQTQSVVHHGKEVSVGIVRQVLDKIKGPKLAMEQAANIASVKKHLQVIHPLQNRDKIIANTTKREKILDKLSKRK